MIWLIGVPERRRRGLLRHRETQTVGRCAQAAALVVLAAEHLDHPVRADRFFQRVRQRARALLHENADALHPPVDLADREADERKRGEGDQRQLPVDVEQIAEHERDGQRVADAHGDRLGRGRRDLLRVERHLREQNARGGRVVERRGQPQQVVPRLAAQVEDDAGADPREAVFADVAADAAQDEHADDHRRHPARALDGDRRDVVQQRLDDAQHHHVGRRDQQHPEDREREDRAVRTHVAEQPAVELHVRRGLEERAARRPFAGADYIGAPASGRASARRRPWRGSAIIPCLHARPARAPGASLETSLVPRFLP